MEVGIAPSLPVPPAKAYIFKPNAGCQGKGIVVTRRPLDLLDEFEESVVQVRVMRGNTKHLSLFCLFVFVTFDLVKEIELCCFFFFFVSRFSSVRVVPPPLQLVVGQSWGGGRGDKHTSIENQCSGI